MSLSTERLGTIIQREIVHIINDIIKNSLVGFYTITETRVTKDLSFCTVYYTILSDDEETIKIAFELLEKHKKEIRMKLASKIRKARRIPDLIFKYDEALAYGNKIDNLLREIKK
ncbi:MAG: 30S ribosome-binding factor RbfA [Acholeplasmataceae bacterium]